LRAADAREVALAALQRRDLSERELEQRLRRRGISPRESEETISELVENGLVDDARLGRARAQLLAERGAGNEAIRHDLLRRGLAAPEVEAAFEALEPEPVRAERVAASLGGGVRAARVLARKGFSVDSIESAVAEVIADGP
jgi:SOS response regulatory protein OraA/RecX